MGQVIGNQRDEKVGVTNTLTSTSTKKALAANQGRILDESKANKDTDATLGNAAIFDGDGNAVDSGVDLADKADKDTDAVTGNVAVFDSGGNAVDGGATLADLNDGWDGQVATFQDLPAASSNNGKKYAVISPTGTIILGTKKYAGTYISDGTNWNIFGYKQASVINQLLTGFTTATSISAIVATDPILSAFGKTQKYFNDFLTNFNGADQLVQLDNAGKLPAIDASQLTNVPSQSLPVGSIIFWDGNLSNIPSGFIYADGSAKSRTTYADLFAKDGTKYGAGDGSSTFNILDARGLVLRGTDNGAGTDPDASSRTINGVIQATNISGTYQGDEFKEHKHQLTMTYHTQTGGGFNGGRIQLTDRTASTAVNPSEIQMANTGGNETRPKNIAFHLLIKY